MLSILYNQDFVTECYENEVFNDGVKQGMQQGMQQGIEQGMKSMQAMLDRLVSAGLINKKEAEKQLSLVK